MIETRDKLFLITTVARTLQFFSGQPRLWNNKFDVCAIASEEDDILVKFAKEESIRYKCVPMKREISLLSDIQCLCILLYLFIKERPKIVHANTPKASVLSMLAAWLTCRPVRIYMCHGLRYETTTGVLLKVLKAMEWVACHCATQVIGVSQGVVNQLVNDGLCPKNKIKVVGYGTAGGIDLTRFSRKSLTGEPQVRLELNIPNDAFVFSFVGRIVRDKGINELVTAFNILSQEYHYIHLLLIGPEEGESDLITSSTKEVITNNNRIYLLGTKEDVRPFIAISDAFVLPSYREGAGQVILEANALDVPCIATDVIGPRDIITPMVNGELVKPRSAEALYDMMRNWIENPDKVSKMAQSSRSFIKARYDQEKVKDTYYKEYCNLAGI